MSERMISGTKFAALQAQLAETDKARIQAEQDRDTAYTRIGEHLARIAELEAALVEERTQRGDRLGVFVGDKMRFSTELLTAIDITDDRQSELVVVESVLQAPDGAKTLLLQRADAPEQASTPDTSDASESVTSGVHEGEGGADLGTTPA